MGFTRNTWRWLRVLQKKTRNLYWRVAQGNFAGTQADFPLTPEGLGQNGFSRVAAAYECPIICPAGQKHLFENKLHNLDLAVSPMQGLLLKPGEIFSFWGRVGNPVASRGYLEGATFIRQRVSSAVGGGLCQLSGLLHNLALLSGCDILERHCHSIDAYGEGRYIPLGRDATVAYPRADLCFKNPYPFPLLLRIEVSRERAQAWLNSPQPLPHEVEIRVQTLESYPSPVHLKEETVPFPETPVEEKGCDGSKVSTWRLFKVPGQPVRSEWLGESFYNPTPTYRFSRQGRAS